MFIIFGGRRCFRRRFFHCTGGPDIGMETLTSETDEQRNLMQMLKLRSSKFVLSGGRDRPEAGGVALVWWVDGGRSATRGGFEFRGGGSVIGGPVSRRAINSSSGECFDFHSPLCFFSSALSRSKEWPRILFCFAARRC